MDHTIIDSL